MAKIKEEILVVKVSTIQKEEGDDTPDRVSSEVVSTIEEVLAELIGTGAIVEVEKA
jgi:hypothetical protein